MELTQRMLDDLTAEENIFEVTCNQSSDMDSVLVYAREQIEAAQFVVSGEYKRAFVIIVVDRA